MPATKGYRTALNHVFALAGTDLATNNYQYNVLQLLDLRMAAVGSTKGALHY